MVRFNAKVLRTGRTTIGASSIWPRAVGITFGKVRTRIAGGLLLGGETPATVTVDSIAGLLLLGQSLELSIQKLRRDFYPHPSPSIPKRHPMFAVKIDEPVTKGLNLQRVRNVLID